MVTTEMNQWCTGGKPEELSDTDFLLYGADSEPTAQLHSVIGLGAFPCSLCSTTSNIKEFCTRFLMAEPSQAGWGIEWLDWGGQREQVSG